MSIEQSVMEQGFYTAARELRAENDRLRAALAEIRALAAEHYDPDADPEDESPYDMAAHINGLIVRLCDET